MASNCFGNIFRVSTWGESHGKAIGVVIDGCPAGLEINEDEINFGLAKRAPGKNAYTSPRKELDQAEILSGVFQGKTTGTPICICIPNQDVDSSKYEPIKDLLRPGHANYSYLEKYGIFDYRGGGRSSGRETACRVAAGVIAKKILKYYEIEVIAFLKQVGEIKAGYPLESIERLRSQIDQSMLFCPDGHAETNMIKLLEQIKEEGDSIGGIVSFMTSKLPPGLGDPIYDKLDANLAKALMGLPASKGFEIGSGFDSVCMKGSQHNDIFIKKEDRLETETNDVGGILAGISTGMPIVGNVVFKPASSIMKSQNTLNLSGEHAVFKLPIGSRHDPCVAIRAVPVVEAMVALVLADALLLNRCARI